MGELLAISSLLFFSTNVIVTKLGSDRMKTSIGFPLALLMNLVIGLIVFGAVLLFRTSSFQWSTNGFFLFFLSGIFATYLGRRFLYESIARLGPSGASSFQVSNPLFTVLIAWLIIGEETTMIDILAVFVILNGLFAISLEPGALSRIRDKLVRAKGREEKNPAHHSNRSFSFQSIKNIVKPGVWFGLISAITYAIGNVVRGTAVQMWNEPIFGALAGVIAGILFQLVFNINVKWFIKELRSADRRGAYFYMLSGIATMFGQIFVIAAMWYMPMSLANLISVATPVIVTPFSYYFLKNQERITLPTVFGISSVLAGIVCIVLF